MPILSIITINFNNKQGLLNTFKSVVNQTFKDFEWIVIDGGSTDGSKEIIEQYSSNITYWVSEPDKGIYNAMNKGIKISKGEYLHFLNSGDCLVSKRILQDVFSVARRDDILIGNNIIPQKGNRINKNVHSNIIYCSDFCNSSICHQATFIKRKLFERIGYYDEEMKISSDWKFFFEAIFIYKCSYQYIDINIIKYDNNGISSTDIETREKERRQVMEQYLPDYVIEDYVLNVHTNEIMKYTFSKKLFGLLYKCVRIYERCRKFQ